MAVVGLNQKLYPITEGDLQVMVCVLVGNPEDENEHCPVAFRFHVSFSTVADSAGIELSDISYIHTYCIHIVYSMYVSEKCN